MFHFCSITHGRHHFETSFSAGSTHVLGLCLNCSAVMNTLSISTEPQSHYNTKSKSGFDNIVRRYWIAKPRYRMARLAARSRQHEISGNQTRSHREKTHQQPGIQNVRTGRKKKKKKKVTALLRAIHHKTHPSKKRKRKQNELTNKKSTRTYIPGIYCLLAVNQIDAVNDHNSSRHNRETRSDVMHHPPHTPRS